MSHIPMCHSLRVKLKVALNKSPTDPVATEYMYSIPESLLLIRKQKPQKREGWGWGGEGWGRGGVVVWLELQTHHSCYNWSKGSNSQNNHQWLEGKLVIIHVLRYPILAVINDSKSQTPSSSSHCCHWVTDLQFLQPLKQSWPSHKASRYCYHRVKGQEDKKPHTCIQTANSKCQLVVKTSYPVSTG